jgi:hypothetical protein
LLEESCLNTPETPQVGEQVLILLPEYAAGKIGMVVAEEILNDGKISGNWLVEVTDEKLIVSLSMDEFQRLGRGK